MTKFTRAQKLKMVKRVVFGGETLKSVCDDTKIVKKDLQLLIAAFRGHGASNNVAHGSRMAISQ